MSGYVYILELSNGRRYTGSTIHKDKRLLQHKNGKVASTKNLRPIKMLFIKGFETILEARRVEYRLKKQKSNVILGKFISGDLELPDFK